MRILAFAGSAREDSCNKKLVRAGAEAVRAAGGAVTLIDLRDYPLPLYDGDLEAERGLPEHAVRLKELFHAHAGLLLSCPEYNGSITPLLKNAIDWVSRPAEGEAPLACFDGKVVALLAASPGALGGLRGLVHVRAILSGIRVLVLPAQLAVGGAYQAFADDGRLADEKRQASLESIAAALVETVRKLRG